MNAFKVIINRNQIFKSGFYLFPRANETLKITGSFNDYNILEGNYRYNLCKSLKAHYKIHF